MRIRSLSYGLVVVGMGMVAGTCPKKDAVYWNYGFYDDADSAIMTYRSAKYENGGPGWWSWLPTDTSLSVSCGVSGDEVATYSAIFMGGDDHLGYSWEETVETVNGCDRYYDPGCEFVIPDEELSDHVCLPWIDVEGVPHPSTGVTVRRGARPDQGTWVECRMVFPEGDPVNTCSTDCDYAPYGFCWAVFVHP